MNNSVLRDLLKEYDQKRTYFIRDAENRKTELYKSNPKLQQIDETLSKISIESAKSILQKNSKDILNNLKKEIENLKAEKENILKSINISEDYLTPNFECKICNDTGYVFKDGKNIMCNCLKQKIYNIEYNQKNINNIETQTFENLDVNLFSDKVEEKKYNSNISPRENISDIKKIAENFVNNFENPETKNLIFSGGTGLRQNISIKLYSKQFNKKRKNCYVSNSSSYA